MYKYIIKKSDSFFDLRNVCITLVENDPLGEAFGVKAFARSQVTTFMRAQLTPFTETGPSTTSPQPEPSAKPDPELKRKRDAGS